MDMWGIGFRCREMTATPLLQAELPYFKKGQEEEKDPFLREKRELMKARDTLKIIVEALAPA